LGQRRKPYGDGTGRTGICARSLADRADKPLARRAQQEDTAQPVKQRYVAQQYQVVFLRLALRKVPRVQATAAFQALTQLVDPLPRIVEHKMRQPEVSIKGPWLPWCLVVLVLVISRYMLLGLLLALF